MVFIIGFFNWPYIGRIIRGQALSPRECEFIGTVRSLGARLLRILFTATFLNQIAPIPVTPHC